MKIGDFAKKYGLNITTVRYYVERALLTPERKTISMYSHPHAWKTWRRF